MQAPSTITAQALIPKYFTLTTIFSRLIEKEPTGASLTGRIGVTNRAITDIASTAFFHIVRANLTKIKRIPIVSSLTNQTIIRNIAKLTIRHHRVTTLTRTSVGIISIGSLASNTHSRRKTSQTVRHHHLTTHTLCTIRSITISAFVTLSRTTIQTVQRTQLANIYRIVITNSTSLTTNRVQTLDTISHTRRTSLQRINVKSRVALLTRSR